jgi:hypothetical protein
MKYNSCPNCNSIDFNPNPRCSGSKICNFCGAHFGFVLRKDISKDVIQLAFIGGNDPEDIFYFDFFIVDARNGEGYRTHGWADKDSRKVVQFG